MKGFSKYTVEKNDQRGMVVALLDVNPPTKSVGKLMNVIEEMARDKGFPCRIYLTSTGTPLLFESKLKYTRKMFPKMARKIVSEPMNTSKELLEDVRKQGYRTIEFFHDRICDGSVSESTRVNETLNEKLEIRQKAKEGKFGEFCRLLPKSFSESSEMYTEMRSMMGLKNPTVRTYRRIDLPPVSQERERYIDGELFREGDAVFVESTGESARIKRTGTNYLILDNGRRVWLNDARKVSESVHDMAGWKAKKNLRSVKQSVSSTVSTMHTVMATLDSRGYVADVRDDDNVNRVSWTGRKGTVSLSFDKKTKRISEAELFGRRIDTGRLGEVEYLSFLIKLELDVVRKS